MTYCDVTVVFGACSVLSASVVRPPTKESRDPALGLADGMKFLLRFGDDRSAVSAPAALAADG